LFYNSELDDDSYFIYTKKVETVQALIELGANVNATNNITGGTPLHCLAQSSKAKSVARRLQVVDLLIQAGANTSMVDFRGRTAVEYCSCDEYDTDALRERLQPQAPPLVRAIQARDVNQLRQVLLEQKEEQQQQQGEESGDGVNVEERYRGLTPLQNLIKDFLQQLDDDTESNQQQQQQQQEGETNATSDWLGMLQVLLEHQANPNALPVEATTTTTTPDATTSVPDSEDLMLHKICLALRDACRAKDTAKVQLLEPVITLLLQHGAIVPTPTQQLLHDAARRNQLDFVKFLLRVVQLNVNSKGRQGMTALQFAARSGQVDMIRYLLSVPNINVLAQDERGQTALDAARANDHSDIVTLLETYLSSHDNRVFDDD
jgi:ankyrin repeat protein